MAIQDYYDGLDLLPEGNLKISPSKFSDFFDHTNMWFREHMLGESGFQGSTATYLGTVVHAYVEKAMLEQNLENFDEEELEPFLETITDFSIDKNIIRTTYYNLAYTLINAYITDHPAPINTERFIHYEIIPGISVGGTYDFLRTNQYGQLMVGDWKTSASKPSSLTKKYQWQLLIYCYILRKTGLDIDGYEVNFVVKPTKTLPARAVQFAYVLQSGDMDFIESLLKLVAESMLAFKEHPTLQYLLAQDYRLHQGPLKLETNLATLNFTDKDI